MLKSNWVLLTTKKLKINIPGLRAPFFIMKNVNIHGSDCLRIDGCNNRDRCGLFGACFLRLLQLNKWLSKKHYTRACTGKPAACSFCQQENSKKCISWIVITDILDTYGKTGTPRKLITHHIREQEFFTTFVVNEWKLKILFRDKICKACGTNRNLTIDHIIPLSKGGTNAVSNLQALCGQCNTLKSDTIHDQ